ncbi:hypothetical protein KTR66_18325 [Roseococcus sp. SDR]|uniref:hypothetical protein n=1 Tax=Roseococcus sp. SDR TaxID=2835532 RepID=UPI001BCBB76D|nr:hypothetical protein [Roseococcus sp. SDR]MBS7791962.1 hypothetical protein [Roseococcus sp. SDR]MBV1847276.1 hypothetical protein [Roseococcus sp. SDR]
MPTLSVADLFAAKAAAQARRHAEEEAAREAHQAELKAFAEKLMTYQITEEDKQRALAKIRRAFENGEKEAMLIRFPSDLCEDQGRRINNRLEGWQETLPGVLKHVHEWWEKELAPGGFTFGARVLDYPGGMPGDIGLFIGWPDQLG